jgi:Spy/CpxP family protein refolding chaperone
MYSMKGTTMQLHHRYARALWAALLAGLTLAYAAPALAQPEQFYHAAPRGKAEGWGAHPMSGLFHDLKLTAAQSEQLKQIEHNMFNDLKSVHEAHRALMRRAVELLAVPTIDEAAIEQNRQEMLKQHEVLSRYMTAAFIAMAKVLTPEQRGQMVNQMKQRMDRWQKRFSVPPVPPAPAVSPPASQPAR